MRILITGAAGYLGRHLRPALQERGYYVIPLYNWPREPHVRHYDAPFEKAWFANLANGFGKLMNEEPPDTVVHLAGRVDISLKPNPAGAHLPPIPGEQDVVSLYRDNVLTTANVVDYCLKVGVKHLIFASSQTVYGMPGVQWVDESTECKPLEHYAASKLAAENVVRMAAHQGLRVTILRLPGVYGGDRTSGIVYNLIRSAVRDGILWLDMPYPLPIDVLHVDDVVGAITKAVQRKSWREEIIQLGSGEPCSLEILADEVAGIVPGCEVVKRCVPQPVLNLNIELAHYHLGWEPMLRKARLAEVALKEFGHGT